MAISSFALSVGVAQDSPAPPSSSPVTGSVQMRVVIGTDGLPFNPVVVRGLTPEYDRLSLDTVRQWRFRAGMKNGKPIPVVAMIVINFGTGPNQTAPPGVLVVDSRPHDEIDPGGRALLAWYVKCAQDGDLEAQMEAARRLSGRKSSNADLIEAYAWATIAEGGGSNEGTKLRSKLARRMTASQVNQATQIAQDWKPGTPLTDQR